MTKLDDLEKLAELKKKGVVTKEEFEGQKKALLEGNGQEIAAETVDTSPLGRYVGCFKKYATFSGRANRAEFWWFTLFNFLAGILAALIPFGGLYSLVALIPGMAVTVRRLHDTNRSGWWYFSELIVVLVVLIFSIPFGISLAATGSTTAETGAFMLVFLGLFVLYLVVWTILLIVFWCLPGTDGENKYGKKPV